MAKRTQIQELTKTKFLPRLKRLNIKTSRLMMANTNAINSKICRMKLFSIHSASNSVLLWCALLQKMGRSFLSIKAVSIKNNKNIVIALIFKYLINL
jgi:hypothetical protein